MKKLLIIDTFNFLHRAYHALPSTFKGPDGTPTNAVYGVTSMLINVLNDVKPSFIAAAMDGPEPTFRLEDFTAYKAQRKPMEDDLAIQIPKVEEVLDSFGIKRLLVNGYEADDIIATLVDKFNTEVEIVIVSNDRDLWQLVGKNVVVMLPNTKGNVEWVGEKEVEARLGFLPRCVPDYKGFRGDVSDNIPGVYGIGEKTATKLIQEFGSLENVYSNIEKVKPDSLREKLLNSYEQAVMSKKLAVVDRNVPLDLDISMFKYSEFNRGNVKSLLQKYNFKSLIARLGFEVPETKAKKDVVPDNQQSLFN